MLGIQNILVATDFSECSARAFRRAHELAQGCQARLDVLYVDKPPRYTHAAPELEERLRQCHPADPGVEVHYLVVEGDPVEEITRMAALLNCDLLVMGTHGRTGLPWLMLGSIAQQVAPRAGCPVLLVPLPRPWSASQEEATAGQAAATGPADGPESRTGSSAGSSSPGHHQEEITTRRNYHVNHSEYHQG